MVQISRITQSASSLFFELSHVLALLQSRARRQEAPELHYKINISLISLVAIVLVCAWMVCAGHCRQGFEGSFAAGARLESSRVWGAKLLVDQTEFYVRNFDVPCLLPMKDLSLPGNGPSMGGAQSRRKGTSGPMSGSTSGLTSPPTRAPTGAPTKVDIPCSQPFEDSRLPAKVLRNVPRRCPRKRPRKVSTQAVEVHLSCFHLLCSSANQALSLERLRPTRQPRKKQPDKQQLPKRRPDERLLKKRSGKAVRPRRLWLFRSQKGSHEQHQRHFQNDSSGPPGQWPS